MKKRAVKKPGFQKRVLAALDKHSQILAEHSEILGMIVKKMATHDDLAQTRMELGGKIDNVSNRLD